MSVSHPETHRDKIVRGMAAARAAGKPIGRPRSDREEQVAELVLAGWTTERVRKHLKVGTEVVQRVRRIVRSGKWPCGQ